MLWEHQLTGIWQGDVGGDMVAASSCVEERVHTNEPEIMHSASRKYAFLDRDGTLIFEPRHDFVIDHLDKLKILDGVIEGLRLLRERDYRLVMVSNQDGLGTEVLPTHAFAEPHEEMLRIFDSADITFEQVFICPHYRADNCDCRKPNTGMLTEFLKSHPLDIERSFVCGDRHNDKGLAENLGLRFLPMHTNGNFLDAISPMVCL